MKNELRSPCPVAGILDIIGDKWTLLVVRDLFLGKSTYNELLDSFEGIPTNLLADRLRRLYEMGLVEKQLYQSKPKRYRYVLTRRGKDLWPVLREAAKWGLRHIEGTHLAAGIKLK